MQMHIRLAANELLTFPFGEVLTGNNLIIMPISTCAAEQGGPSSRSLISDSLRTPLAHIYMHENYYFD